MTNIVVTGGAGFIGSNLCEFLLKDSNNSIWSVDNYFTGSTENHINGVTYLRANASDILTLDLPDRIDYVFHFGEYSRVEQSFEDIDTVFAFNGEGIIKVLQFCNERNAKLIYSGSSTKFAHGEVEGKYQSPYAWTKATNTDLVKAYAQWFDVDYAIAYFYNVFGKREISEGQYSTLIARFTTMMRNDEKLTVVSPGTQERNFTHISDVVKALDLISKRGSGDGYGIGNEKSYTVLEVAQAFGGDIRMLPERRGNRMSASVEVEKTQALGWKATYNLLDYIELLKKHDFKKEVKWKN